MGLAQDDLTLREPLLDLNEDTEDVGSRFRRLIEQTPPDFLTRVRHRFLNRNLSQDFPDENMAASNEGWRSAIHPSLTKVSLLALYVSQIFLIWVSLASPQWMELRIRLPFHADISIETFGLSDLMQKMYSAEMGPPTIFLWVFSLVLPSLFTIFAPSFVWNDSTSLGRVVLESLQHAPFAAIYLMNLLAAFYNIKSSDIQVRAEAEPSIAAFGSGIICSMLYVTGVRLQSGIPKQEVVDETAESDDEDSEPMRILEDVPSLTLNDDSSSDPPVEFWKKFAMLQLGLLSLFLWVPTFFFPYCTLTVDSGFLRVLRKEVGLGQIIGSLPSSLMFMPVVVGPLSATMTAFAAWMLDTRFKVHVYALRPWIGSINLALTLWGVLHLIPKILVLPALSIHAEAGWGLFISLIQAVCIELFIEGTIAWLP